MSLRAMWSEFLIAVRRPATVAVLGGMFVLGLIDAVQVLGREPLGVLGTVTLNTDGVLTYGLAGSALLTAIVVGGHSSLGDLWHSRGRGLHERLVQALALAVPLAIASRVVALLGITAGGVIDCARRGWRWGSVVPVDAADLATGQGRQLLAYLIAAAFGAVVALAARNQTIAVAVVLAATVPYTPFVGALANRAGPVLDAFPWAPFGALRGALTGNGGIFGTDPQHSRLVDIALASVVLVGWFALVVVWYLFGTSIRSDRPMLMYAVPVPAATLAVVVVAVWLPSAVAGDVPWRWTPDWRHAKAHGDDSRSVAERWAGLVRVNDPTSSVLFDGSASNKVGADIAEVLTAATAVEAEPESKMISPEFVQLNVTFEPELRSGNVLLDKAQFLVRLRQAGDVWRIVRVEGPFVHVKAAP